MSNKCFILLLTRTNVYNTMDAEVIEMEKLIKKYGGLILLYSVIVVMIVLINARFTYLKEINQVQDTYAYND